MTQGRLAGKIALVSGAGRGIGEAIVRRFHAEGATVIVTDINPEGCAVAESLGENALFIHLDATSEAAWDAALEEVMRRYGRLDVLVNNAGGSAGAGPFEAFEVGTHRHVMDLNLTSTWLGSRCALRAMTPGGGSIVNISSMDGLAGIAGMASYVAAKFGVTGLTRTLALELGDRGIRVNSVHPGFIGTPMVKGASDAVKERLRKSIAQQPIKRYGEPEEIASAALFFASSDGSFCTGSSLLVDGGHLAGPWRETV
ncbi:MAG: SDR family NAD(P)-dependent oxidoreductase [Parasphingorhabdus sp.]